MIYNQRIEMSWNPTQPLPPAFKHLPHRVYTGDPHWIPEDLDALDRLFSEEHTYFQYGQACIEIAGDKARLAGFYNPRLRIDGKKVGFFGYWETVDEEAVNRRLFRRVEAWARQQGAERLYGPVNFSTFHTYRVRLNEFEAGCFPGEPYNPPYYSLLLNRMGYTLAEQYVSLVHRRVYHKVAARLLRLKATFVNAGGDPSLRLVPLTPAYWMDNLKRFHALVESIFRQNFAYTSIPYPAFEAACGEAFSHTICSRTSFLMMNEADDILAFFIAFPDYGPLLRQGNPNRVQRRDLRYDVHFPALEHPTFLAKTLGVHPAYRRRGLLNTLATAALLHSIRYYHDGIVCLMKEDNPSVRYARSIAESVRRYGLFVMEL